MSEKTEAVQTPGPRLRLMGIGLLLLLGALALMRWSIPPGVRHEDHTIEDGAKIYGGTLWQPPSPQAVVVLGHGVSCNRGMLAGLAKAFAGAGYAAIAIDFNGHGRSREGFDWHSNAATVLAWLQWARSEFPGLKVAYLGHSMGAIAGSAALENGAAADAFVSMGALPQFLPQGTTLIAAGRMEELFTPEQARAHAGDRAEVVISPWSDHILEPWDPILTQHVIAWVNRTLALEPYTQWSWWRWLFPFLGAVAGIAGAMRLVMGVCGYSRAREMSSTGEAPARGWTLNPYRLTARMLGDAPGGTEAVRGRALTALVTGALFAVLTVFLCSLVLNQHLFTCRLDHPGRLLAWAIAGILLLPIFWLDATALERAASSRRRRVAFVTRCIPLLVLGGILLLFTGGVAFLGMLIWIFTGVCALLTLVQFRAAGSLGGLRAGAAASAVTFAWVLMFWFPAR